MNRFDLLIFEDAQEMLDRKAKEKKERERKLQEIEEDGRCEGFEGPCDCREDVSWYTSMTCYSWNMEKNPEEDPNRDIFFCPRCGQGYIRHWEETWNDYNAGRL